MIRGLVLMTALPFHKGHKALLDFGRDFMSQYPRSNFHIMLNSRSFEPIPGWIRMYDIWENMPATTGANGAVLVHHCTKDDVPQNPDEHPDFWNYWKKLIREETGFDRYDFVFASEPYGMKLAEVLGAEFVPFNIDRDVHNVSGTEIREDIDLNFNKIVGSNQKKFLQNRVTFFGAESCGKTTMAKHITFMVNEDYRYATFLPEWARPYLETVGPELNDTKMQIIANGQYALQKAEYDTAWVFQDTDLLSTLGYYRILGMDVPPSLIKMINETISDLYIVMNSKIPFEKDPIRYGGDKRQSSDKFWIDILEEFGCNYYAVHSADPFEQEGEVLDVLNEQAHRKWSPLRNFVRT